MTDLMIRGILRKTLVAVGGGGVIALASCGEQVPDGGASRPSIDYVEEAKGPLVAVHGLPANVLDALSRTDITAAEWNTALGVYSAPIPEVEGSLPVMLGSYELEPERLIFRARFPFVRGLEHEVRLDLDALSRLSGQRAGEGLLTHKFTPPEGEAGPPTRVTAIYPTSGTVPMNLLKLYIHFSAPMRFGEAYSHIRLVDEDGTPVPDAFLEMPQELWDPERSRLTLFFDPGRIKREVGPNVQLGLPLQAGRRYLIVIDPEWRDARGRPLEEGFEKAITVAEPDRVIPQIGDWVVDPPDGESTNPLRLTFDEPIDHALAERMLVVLHLGGEPVLGTVEVGPQERSWEFTPSQPWAVGSYVIDVHPDLEDLAGNNLAHLFDVNREDDVRLETEDARARIPFRVSR